MRGEVHQVLLARRALALSGGLCLLLALGWSPARVPALVFVLCCLPGLLAIPPQLQAGRALDLTLVVAASLAVNIGAALLGLYLWKFDMEAVIGLAALFTAGLWWLGQRDPPGQASP